MILLETDPPQGSLNNYLFVFGDRLRSFMEMCILIPGSSLKHGGISSKQVKRTFLLSTFL